MRDPSKGVREVREAHEVSDAVARLVGVFGWGILGLGMLRDKGLGLHGSANACPIAIVISSQAAKPETQPHTRRGFRPWNPCLLAYGF